MTAEPQTAPSPWATYRDATGQHLGQVWADAPDGAVWVLPALGGPPVSVRDWEAAGEPTADALEPSAPVEPPAPASDPRRALVGQWVTGMRPRRPRTRERPGPRVGVGPLRCRPAATGASPD